MAQFSSLASSMKQKGFDIESLQDAEGNPVDELIKPLVLVLNHKGYQTIASCQGHSLEEHKKKIGKNEKISKETPFSFMHEKKYGELKIKVLYDQAPWVDLQVTAEQKKELAALVEKYNKESSIAWNMRDNLGMTEPSCRLSAHHEHEINELHEQIEKLAGFIQSDF